MRRRWAVRALGSAESCEALYESGRIFQVARDFEDGHVYGPGRGRSSLAASCRLIRCILISFTLSFHPKQLIQVSGGYGL